MVKGKTASTLLEGLNVEQLKAVQHDQGPALVVAGPGTGKTRVITTRIAYLIEQKKAVPEAILALTFTDKAAREMEERVDQLLPYGYVDTQIMTFHALGYRLLQDNPLEAGLPPSFKLVSGLQQHVILREVLEALNDLKVFRPLHNPGQYREVLLRYFSRLKDEGLDPVGYKRALKATQTGDASPEDQEKYQEIGRIYEAYQERLHAEGFVDYGDQLLLSMQLLEKNVQVRQSYQDLFQYILVDEFQDTNAIQARLLYALCNTQQNIMVVGDDDQSIYRFRGAELRNILDFQTHFKKADIIVLGENYRSTQEIIDLSYELIQHNNPDRLEVQAKLNKHLRAQSRGEQPEVIQLASTNEELAYIATEVSKLIKAGESASSVAVICRNNNQAADIIQALHQRGVPVASVTAKSLFHQPVVRQCIDFIRVVHDPTDSAALYRYLISPRGGAKLQDVMSLSAAAGKARRSLNLELESTELVPTVVKNSFLVLEAYRTFAHDHSIGEVLYKFVTSDGYLDSLVEAAESNFEAARAVQQLAAFFGLVKEFEAVDTHRDSLGFWNYIQDMYDTEVLDDVDIQDAEDGVHVLTGHRAKGLEFATVFLYDLTEGSFPATRKGEGLKMPRDLMQTDPLQRSRDHESEERRLFYVATTRAQTRLIMTYAPDHGGKRARKVSRFVLEAFAGEPPTALLGASGLPAVVARYAPTDSTRQMPPSYPETQGWLDLSPNQIADYLDDPWRFYTRHVLRFPSPPTHQLIYGTAIHAALEYFYKEKLAGKQPKLTAMLETFTTSWRSEGFVSLRHETERRQAGVATIRRLYTDGMASQEVVVAVEESFKLELTDLKVRLHGRYDLIVQSDSDSNAVEIRDFKTSQVAEASTAADRVRDTIQLHIYALAWQRIKEQPVKAVSLHFVETGILAKRSKIDNEKTVRKIGEAAAGIRAGRFSKAGIFSDLETDNLSITEGL